MIEKILELTRKQNTLFSQLEAPARAAANQMKDAGMHKGADPLLEILFQIDACKEELMQIFKSDPQQSVEAIISLMKKDKNA